MGDEIIVMVWRQRCVLSGQPVTLEFRKASRSRTQLDQYLTAMREADLRPFDVRFRLVCVGDIDTRGREV